MDIEKLAREAGACELFGRDLALMGRESIARLIEAVRRETAEEAAKVAEEEFVGQSLNDDTLCMSDVAYNMALKHAAAAIRERFKAS